MPKFNIAQFEEGDDLSDTPVEGQPSVSFQRGNVVPNKFPLLDGYPNRIAIVGEAPGKDEEIQGQPFVGMSGKLLTNILNRVGLVREGLFIGNICQYRPPSNKVEYWYKYGTTLQEGLEQLKADLQKFKPNIVLLLGKTALLEAKGTTEITKWRGSLFVGNPGSPFEGFKCVASFHPAFILRQYSWSAYLLYDIIKAKEESLTPELTLPQRNLIVDLPCDALVAKLEALNSTDCIKVSPDLEGYWHNLSCISIATDPMESFIVPFAKLDGSHYWNEDEEFFVWKALISVLENPKVLKCWQNGLYDRFVLQYGYGIVVRGNVDDTLLKFWEWRCELRKKLSVQASILTREQFWKDERFATEDEEVAGH